MRNELIQSQIDTPIRVLFFEPYPMGLGGNFLTQRLILARLDRRQFTPIVVSPVDGIALEEFRKMGVECTVIPPPGNLNRYGGALLRAGILGKIKATVELLQYNLKLVRFLRKKQVDVVYSNFVRAEMSIGLAARLVRVPSFLYIKGELGNPVIDWLSFMLATKIFFQCEQNRDDKYHNLVHFCQNKIGILNPGMDPAVFKGIKQEDKTTLSQELDIDLVYTNAVVPSQLYPPKGQHLVLEALSQLVNDFPKVRLYLLGGHVI